MNKTETKLFLEILSEIPDKRQGNGIRHRLNEILTIALLGILCNANTLTGLERFGKAHEEALRQFLELPNGIPSHDTFGDVLGRLDYLAVERLFRKWLKEMHGQLAPHNVAMDGKTVRRSESAMHKAAHIVTAYSSDLQLVLGQVLTKEKSNEMTAIPELLDTLDIQGATVTIDAMGTQTAIAEKIIHRGGDYVLALKENHPGLLEDARYYFQEDCLTTAKEELRRKGRYAHMVEKGHGRIEKRECWLIQDEFTGFLFRKLVLQLLKHDTTLKGSLAGKREICAWRFDLALKLLLAASFS